MASKIVTCKIIRFHNNPVDDETGKTLPGTNVEIECSIGQRKWTILRYVYFDRPISMEEFKRDLALTKLIPDKPKDTLAYVKEEVNKPFEIVVAPKKTK